MAIAGHRAAIHRSAALGRQGGIPRPGRCSSRRSDLNASAPMQPNSAPILAEESAPETRRIKTSWCSAEAILLARWIAGLADCPAGEAVWRPPAPIAAVSAGQFFAPRVAR